MRTRISIWGMGEDRRSGIGSSTRGTCRSWSGLVGLLDLIIQYLVRAAVGMKGVGRLQYH